MMEELEQRVQFMEEMKEIMMKIFADLIMMKFQQFKNLKKC